MSVAPARIGPLNGASARYRPESHATFLAEVEEALDEIAAGKKSGKLVIHGVLHQGGIGLVEIGVIKAARMNK